MNLYHKDLAAILSDENGGEGRARAGDTTL